MIHRETCVIMPILFLVILGLIDNSNRFKPITRNSSALRAAYTCVLKHPGTPEHSGGLAPFINREFQYSNIYRISILLLSCICTQVSFSQFVEWRRIHLLQMKAASLTTWGALMRVLKLGSNILFCWNDLILIFLSIFFARYRILF